MKARKKEKKTSKDFSPITIPPPAPPPSSSAATSDQNANSSGREKEKKELSTAVACFRRREEKSKKKKSSSGLGPRRAEAAAPLLAARLRRRELALPLAHPLLRARAHLRGGRGDGGGAAHSPAAEAGGLHQAIARASAGLPLAEALGRRRPAAAAASRGGRDRPAAASSGGGLGARRLLPHSPGLALELEGGGDGLGRLGLLRRFFFLRGLRGCVSPVDPAAERKNS